MEHAVWDKLMRGLSTRNYGAVVKDFHEAYGVEKSAVSDNFIASSREKLQELMERPLGELRLCAPAVRTATSLDSRMCGESVTGLATASVMIWTTSWPNTRRVPVDRLQVARPLEDPELRIPAEYSTYVTLRARKAAPFRRPLTPRHIIFAVT
jgi:hypothetical protein